MANDPHCTSYSMKSYYRQFSSLIRLSSKQAKWLNPFIFASMAINLVIVCLTIYFITQASKIVPQSISEWTNIDWSSHQNLTKEEKFYLDYVKRSFLAQCFNMIWAILQVISAIAYLIIICASGSRTNEKVDHLKLNLSL